MRCAEYCSVEIPLSILVLIGLIAFCVVIGVIIADDHRDRRAALMAWWWKEPEYEYKFNVGDLVRLKSGGPPMTVMMEVPPFCSVGWDIGVHCNWFDGDRLRYRCFYPGQLEVAKMTDRLADRLRTNLCADCRRAATRIDGLEQALTLMVEEKADYMTLNHLGDPEREHTIKVARAALQTPPIDKPSNPAP